MLSDEQTRKSARAPSTLGHCLVIILPAVMRTLARRRCLRGREAGREGGREGGRQAGRQAGREAVSLSSQHYRGLFDYEHLFFMSK